MDAENQDEFNLPQHDLGEQCYDEYHEEIDSHGQYVRHDVEPTSHSMVAPGYATEVGQNFSLDLTKSVKVQTYFNEHGRKVTKMRATKSAWIHNVIFLSGKKFDFEGREYLRQIYDHPCKEILLKTGRQVEKSTMLANNLTIMCALMPFFRCLYVSPSHVQTRTFSNDKLRPTIERSPLIQRYLQDSNVSQQVFEKGFTNGSFIFLRSAFLSADRARGISSDLLCLDELQDLILSNIPVIAQCLSHSKHGYHIYAGTPKTFDNTIEVIWDSTTQNEWMVPCDSCSGATGKKWNFLDLKNIGKTGPICKYCGRPLDVTKGQWQRSAESRVQGFRIPQLMVPWIAGNPNQWGKLVHDMETYPESQFYNEVLGLSYDSASKPITRADVLLNCDPKQRFIEDPLRMTPEEKSRCSKQALFAGVDWGEGNDGTGTDIMGKIRTASYTVLTVGGFISNGKFKVLYSKRYKGKEIDPDYVVEDIVKICVAMNVKMIGVDWGHGWGVNNKLFRMYGAKRCVQFMYVDRQKEVRKWDPVGFKFQLLRNHVMSELFFMFKDQKFLFPPLEQWEIYAKDMFNISIEYVEYQRKLRYVHRPSDPDDWFHSLNYCVQVAKVFHGKR